MARPAALEELPLFAARPRARTADPATSHEAAASITDGARAGQYRLILALLAEHPAGLTNDQIDLALSWRTGTASRRVAELVGAGVERCTETRPTSTGRGAHVHRLASRRAGAA